MNILSLVSQQIDVAGQSNWPDHIRLDSIRQNLYSIRFDSTYFLKNHIRFDSIRLSRIESNRIIRQFDSFSVSGALSFVMQKYDQEHVQKELSKPWNIG